MPDHDPLEASEWGDVPSANSSAFGGLNRTIADELSTTFAQTGVNEDSENDCERDLTTELHATEDSLDQNVNRSSDEDADESVNIHDRDDHNVQPKSPVETKDTKELLSALTLNSKENDTKKETFVSPKRDEALFDQTKKTTNMKLPSSHLGYEEDESYKNHSLSPNRLRRQNMYKAPRFRRHPLKRETADSGPEPQDLMGPLGLQAEEEETLQKNTETPAEAILRQSEAPLFEINRTPLSPFKSEAQDEVVTEQPDEPQQSRAYEAGINFNITVGDPMKVGDLTSAHTVYSVRTLTDSDLFAGDETVVSRRYRDFRWLYRQLQQTHPGRFVPPPPDKQAVGRFNQSFIEARRFALEKMLIKISQNIHFQKDPDFIMFLQSERFSSEAREHEKALDVESSFTENTDGSLSNNSGGFLSSIGGAFSFAPKIAEPDEYFKDKKSYIEALDHELRAFSKNLETVVVQRQDLSVVTEEFAHIVSTLSDLEVSKVITQLFQEFSNTQLRIKALLDRLSLQDLLTLGSTLDEYQRIIGSIRSTFDQRDKILMQLAKSESDLKKKQNSYDKAFNYNRTQTDKIELLKQELSALESKNYSIKERFQSIGNVITGELKSFEFEKIHDFRNSIEIFLESTIESQKEAVELWETFYNTNLTTVEQASVSTASD